MVPLPGEPKVTAPGLYAKLPYDPLKDLQPITQVIATPIVIVAHPSFPAKNVKDLVAYAKARPGATAMFEACPSTSV
jgi:tripartite-type tricarboxylate transporter receptor subunit TctC